MKKRVLTFDDSGIVGDYLKEMLETDGFEVTDCIDCYRVIEELKNAPFDYYILDLNVSTRGLPSAELSGQTRGGLLTGWILLIHVIAKADPKAINNAIIFSDYTTRLERYINDLSEDPEDQQGKYDRIKANGCILHKTERASVLRGLLKRLEGK